MVLRDLQKLVNKEKRRMEKIIAARKAAAGVSILATSGKVIGIVAAVGVATGIIAAAGVATGVLFARKSGKETRNDLKRKAVNTVETIKDTVRKQVDIAKDSVAHTAQEVCSVIKDVHGKTEDVEKDIREGYHGMIREVHDTAEKVSNDFNK